MADTRIPPRMVLLDIEGTTLPVAFVHKVLFPYARKHLPALLEQHENPVVQEALAQIAQEAPGVPPLEQLERWMAQDAKVAPLKSLQGLCWQQGYEKGELEAQLYSDVEPTLKAWKAAGLTLAVYSSGSEAAQKLIYGYTEQGNLTSLFSAFFDRSACGRNA